MPKNALPIPELSDEQKAYIAKYVDQQDLRTLCQNVWGDPTLTLREVRAKAVKGHIALIGKSPLVLDFQERPLLTDEHKKYIEANYRQSTPLEMSRLLSGSASQTPTSRFTMAVIKFCQQLDPTYIKDEEPVDGEYQPPKNVKELLFLVNQFALNPRGDGRKIYNPDKLSASDMRQLQALLDYMRTPLFKVQADKYIRKRHRELFEAEFVKLCWDKPDLLAEELNQYISYVAELVKCTQIEKTVQLLDERLNETLTNGENGQLKMNEVELLNSVREKSNSSLKQQRDLLKTLIGNRSDRINAKISSNATMHNLVEAMIKKESRDRLIMANEEERRPTLVAEVERLSKMEQIKVEIFGLNEEDIVR